MPSTTVVVGVWAAALYVVSRLIGYFISYDTAAPYRNDVIVSTAAFLCLLGTLPFFLGFAIK